MVKAKESTKELKDLPVKDLVAKSRDLTQELFNLRLQNVSGSLENTSQIRRIKRDIARAKTYLAQKSRQG